MNQAQQLFGANDYQEHFEDEISNQGDSEEAIELEPSSQASSAKKSSEPILRVLQHRMVQAP